LQSAHAFTSETVLTITTGESPVYLAVGLNNIGAASEEQHVVKVGSSPVAEPILLKPGVSRLTISVDIGALRSGLYFLKVYLVSLVGITERSVPIRAWKDARLEQP
jgi:hypothetical protein